MTDGGEEAPWLARADFRPEEEFYRPIGEMMWAFGWLEQQLDFMLICLLAIDPLEAAQAVLSQISNFEAKVDLFSQLANLRLSDDTQTPRIKRLHDDLDCVNGKRNNIVHGRGSSFTWPPLRVALTRAKPRSETFGTKVNFYTADEISAMSNDIISVGTELGKLRFEIIDLFAKTRPAKSQ